MAESGTTPAWREFEKLIARIESAMAPSGAVVISPDRIRDNSTGELREVDASIRYKVGTSPVLITIECRDRNSTEDVRWIEQLAEKKRAIGAAVTLAVSSTGFSVPAIKKASTSGIETRTLTDATAQDFSQWLAFQCVDVDLIGWSLEGLDLELYDLPSDAELSPAVQKTFRELGLHAPIFIRNFDGKPFHVENICIEWQKRNTPFFASLPPDATKTQLQIHQRFDRNGFHVETTKGNFDIEITHIALSVHRSKSRVPVSKLAAYSDASTALIQTAEWTLPTDLRLSLHRDLCSGETKVVMTSEPPAKS